MVIKMAEKERVNLVVTGHVDHGKSTSLGHMLFLLGQIHDPKRNRAPWRILEKFFKESRELGMGSWQYAWVLDPLAQERERGLTINISHTEFQSNKYIFNLIDAPGHADFVKNMITGASQADAAILMVSARPGEFEDGLKTTGTASAGKYANVIGMTLEHMLLLISLGITDIVVGVNKMDTVDWKKDRYDAIVKQLTQIFTLLMKNLNVENFEEKVKKIQFVPMSGLVGVNMLPKDMTLKNLEKHIEEARAGKADPEFIETLEKEKAEIEKQWPDWYKGPSLLEALDMLPSPKIKQEEMAKKPLRIPIQSSHNISGVGTVLTGRVASGIVKPGMIAKIAPTKLGLEPVEVEIKSIQEFHKDIPQALPGDNIGMNIKAKNLGYKDIIRGAVLTDKDHPVRPLRPGKDGFLALTLVVRGLGKAKKGASKEERWGVHVGYTPVLHCGTAQVAVRVMEMKTLDGKDAEKIFPNQRGMIWYTPASAPVVVEPLADSPALGRFALRDSGKTIAVGVVQKVEYDKYGQ